MRIYLASPYGFAESTTGFLSEMKRRLRRAGHVVEDPWEMGAKLIRAQKTRARRSTQAGVHPGLQAINRELGRTNQRAIDRSDVVVAALDGPDVDSGTASEIGYAYGTGKRILGYRGDMRQTGENPAVRVNLQVQYWIESSGGRIVRTLPELVRELRRGDRPSSRNV